MQLNIFNKELVTSTETTFNISFHDIEIAYREIFSEYKLPEVNIVFVKPQYIQGLNKEYRDVNSPTDVLSFDLSNDSNIAEIYICPEYVYNSFKGDDFEEEILRLIIHGTLHILGYNHTESLNENPNTKMFKLQEKLLLKMKKNVSSNRLRKSR